MWFMRGIALLSALLVTGCATNPMTISKDQAIQPPGEDKSQFVFLRSSFVGSAINASLYDVTGGEPKFLGIIANNTKITYEAEPGDRTFMVVSEAADFMEAETVAGRRYYAIVTPRMGVWKARFSLWPIKTDPDAEYHTKLDEFDQWRANTERVEITPEARAWYRENRKSVKEKQDAYWPKWQQRPANDIAQRTLHAQDGI
jgi:hypothetical protein